MAETTEGTTEQEETPPLKPAKHEWRIVVAGAMDPRQHHPFWYKTIGCLSEEEFLRTAGVLTPVHAQFENRIYAIACTPDRWDIWTKEPEHIERIQQVASRVFTKLYEVPVAAIGINTVRHLKTSVPSVRGVLTRLIVGMGLGFTTEGKTDAIVTFVNRLEKSERNYAIGQSTASEETLYLECNHHHPLGGSATGYIDLAPEIRKFAESDWKFADRFGEEMVAKINDLARD